MAFNRPAPAQRLALPAKRRDFLPLLRPLLHSLTPNNKAPANHLRATEVVYRRLAA